MSRPLTESEAWRLVAERHLAHAVAGLCSDVHSVAPFGIRGKMYYRIETHLAGKAWAYPPIGYETFREYCEDHREARCLAALWLALEAEEESC